MVYSKNLNLSVFKCVIFFLLNCITVFKILSFLIVLESIDSLSLDFEKVTGIHFYILSFTQVIMLSALSFFFVYGKCSINIKKI